MTLIKFFVDSPPTGATKSTTIARSGSFTADACGAACPDPHPLKRSDVANPHMAQRDLEERLAANDRPCLLLWPEKSKTLKINSTNSPAGASNSYRCLDSLTCHAVDHRGVSSHFVNETSAPGPALIYRRTLSVNYCYVGIRATSDSLDPGAVVDV